MKLGKDKIYDAYCSLQRRPKDGFTTSEIQEDFWEMLVAEHLVGGTHGLL